MRRKHRLKELTIKDNFMFGAVMMDENNCRGLLERVLEIPIDRVEVSREKIIQNFQIPMSFSSVISIHLKKKNTGIPLR
ncbi:hypothetical protein HMPREF0987_00075 [Lachnospiraceae bacterium 9_1_43BFAA]|nr:hypothetical protein HMPREF0987_00075 [Lachnospiraceae bacterium 9_1_43BFAA]